jgi:hypothetical protein
MPLSLPHYKCQTEGLGKEDAELLVYLVNEEMDIYIGIRRCLPPWFCRLNPFSYLGVVAVASVLSP